jgi:hypothetical protein
MLPRPAWDQAALAVKRRSIAEQQKARRVESLIFLFILAIPYQNVDIQTFE